MKIFSQFTPIKGGKKRFKQAPVAAICYKLSCDNDITQYQLVITGTESFTFNAANYAVYFRRSEIASKEKSEIIAPTCTHFKYGKGNVLANMNNGEFIFNTNSATSTTCSGNVSFKDTERFTSLDAATKWFKEQYANGTPVTITYYLKNE